MQVGAALKHLRGNSAGKWTPKLLKRAMRLAGRHVTPAAVVVGPFLPFSGASTTAANKVLAAIRLPKGTDKPEVGIAAFEMIVGLLCRAGRRNIH